ncbi:hypothetical protein HN51_015882 [Arachis hypogaea]
MEVAFPFSAPPVSALLPLSSLLICSTFFSANGNGGSFDSVNEYLLRNILARLPARWFASAACVSKSWSSVLNRILTRPKLSSALSLNPSLSVTCFWSKIPSFNSSRLSLLDRGFIYVIAHICGGGEMGRPWYENGKFLKKKNIFTDFIACAEYLIENKFCSKESLCIGGRSAGGLLIGAVLNMRPDLFKAAVAGVPFVDVLTTMLDPTIPLTTSEWKEWGDPRKEEFYFYIKSYFPVDDVKAQNYPHILVTAGLNDPRVIYSEPSKFVAKMRDMKTDDNILLFKCELGAGHFSKPGR